MPNYGTIKKFVIVECALLLVQFWLGMSTNLFVSVPSTNLLDYISYSDGLTLTSLPIYPLDFFSYSGGVEVLAHIVNGFLVIAFALLIIASSIRLKDSFISKLSLLAIVFVVSAIITGFLYVLGGQNDSFSIAMAMSFIFVYTVYFSELYFIRGKQ